MEREVILEWCFDSDNIPKYRAIKVSDGAGYPKYIRYYIEAFVTNAMGDAAWVSVGRELVEYALKGLVSHLDKANVKLNKDGVAGLGCIDKIEECDEKECEKPLTNWWKSNLVGMFLDNGWVLRSRGVYYYHDSGCVSFVPASEVEDACVFDTVEDAYNMLSSKAYQEYEESLRKRH